jgi:hypothetical protein
MKCFRTSAHLSSPKPKSEGEYLIHISNLNSSPTGNDVFQVGELRSKRVGIHPYSKYTLKQPL